MSTPKPICLKCNLFFKPKKCGQVVEERMPVEYDDGEPHIEWEPYKLWMADIYECRGCGARIVVGFGLEPIVEHFQKEKYAHWAPFIKAHVNDC